MRSPGTTTARRPAPSTCFGHLAELLLGAGRQHDVGTGLGQCNGSGGTDAAAAGGDDGDMVGDEETVEDHPANIVARPAWRSDRRGRRLLGLDQTTDGVDQGQVGERLREVARGARRWRRRSPRRRAAAGPAKFRSFLHSATAPARLADHGERRDQPERADGEGPLLAREPGVGACPPCSAGPGRPRSARRRWRARCPAPVRRRAAGTRGSGCRSSEASSSSLP